MIAPYPSFSKLDISHQKEVKSITDQFDPYSDFNFTSLFCWDVDKTSEISLLNDNLVIMLPDYMTGQSVFSVIGDNRLDDTLVELVSAFGELKLIPEKVVTNLQDVTKLEIHEDEDNFDYIYSLAEHASLSGPKFKEKRKKTARFARVNEAGYKLKPVDINNPDAAQEIRSTFSAWAKSKEKADDDTRQELLALERLLENADHFQLRTLVMELGGRPAGFSIHEIINDIFAISHFHKTVSSYDDNIDVFMNSAAAKDLLAAGCSYDNWEQDLGIPTLRKSKLSYKPVRFLKKYIVKPAR